MTIFLAVDGIDYFGAGAEDMAQSLGLPGEPQHPRVGGDLRQDQSETARRRQTDVRRRVAASISPFDLTRDAIADLLQQHGRQTKLGW